MVGHYLMTFSLHTLASTATPSEPVKRSSFSFFSLQELRRQSHQTARALPLALHVHLERHLTSLLHRALLGCTRADLARRALLLKQLASLAHRQTNKLALGRAAAGAAAAARKHLHGLHGCCVAHAGCVGLGAVVLAAKVLLVVCDGLCEFRCKSVSRAFGRCGYRWGGKKGRGAGRGRKRTLLINLLVCQLALVAHEVAQNTREEVGTTRAAGVARGVLGSTLVEVLLVGVVVGDAVLHCNKEAG